MEYTADPSTADLPLNADEVAQLARTEGKALRNDPRRLSHFLARVTATIRRHGDEVRQLKGELERMRHASSQGVGQATTLSPLDAVRYLSPEQLQQVFGAVARQQMDWLNQQQAEADAAKRRATKVVADVRYLVVQLREDSVMAKSALTTRLAQIVEDGEAAAAGAPFQGPGGGMVAPPFSPTARPTSPHDRRM